MTLLSDHIQLICKWVRPSGSASKFRFKANPKPEEGGSIKCYWVLGIAPRGQRVWSRSACAPSLCCLLPWLWYWPYLSLSVVSLKTGVMIFQAQWCHGAWPRLDRGKTHCFWPSLLSGSNTHCRSEAVMSKESQRGIQSSWEFWGLWQTREHKPHRDTGEQQSPSFKGTLDCTYFR